MTSGRCAITRKNGLAYFVFASRPARYSFSEGSTRLTDISPIVKALQKIAIPFHEIVLRELLLRLPSQVVKDAIANLAGPGLHAIENQLDLVPSRVGKP